MSALILNLSPLVRMNDDDFESLCQSNPDLKLERTEKGELVVMPLATGEGGRGEADLITDLNVWNRSSGLGVVFSSSTGFKLPSGANRSPDAASSRIIALPWLLLLGKEKSFHQLHLTSVIELRSATDDIEPLIAKMQEYMENGVRLGWLINPQDRIVEIYRQGQPKQTLEAPGSISGEDVLPGFVLDLSRIEE